MLLARFHASSPAPTLGKHQLYGAVSPSAVIKKKKRSHYERLQAEKHDFLAQG